MGENYNKQVYNFFILLIICLGLLIVIFSVYHLVKFFYFIYISQMSYKVILQSLDIIIYEKETSKNEKSTNDYIQKQRRG